MINLQNKMAVKVKYAMALYHKMNATRSTFYIQSFMLYSRSAHLLHYAAPLLGPIMPLKLPIMLLSNASFFPYYVQIMLPFSLNHC